MVKYLVSYWDGISPVSKILKIDKNYNPADDDCYKLKLTIVMDEEPMRYKYYMKESGGNLFTRPTGKITVDDIQLISVCKLG